MEKKMTQMEMYTRVAEALATADVEDQDELVAFIESRIELLARKKEKSTTPKEDPITDKIKEALEMAEDYMSLKDLVEAIQDSVEDEVTPGKISARIRKMTGVEKAMAKIEGRKVTVYRLEVAE